MNWDIYWFLQKPPYQGIFFLLLTILFVLVVRPGSADKAWLISVYAFMLFLLTNSVMLWFDDNSWYYFFYSLASSFGYLIFISIIMSTLLRILKLDGSGESSMAFLVIIYHPFALLLVMLAKWVMNQWF